MLIVGWRAGLFQLWGGAHLLVGVAGYNFGRVLPDPGSRADRLRHLVVPSTAIALVPIDNYLRRTCCWTNKFLGPHDSMTAGGLWFVEVLVWILVALVAVCWWPVADRVERRRPFGFGAAALAAALALGLDVARDSWFTMLAFWLLAPG